MWTTPCERQQWAGWMWMPHQETAEKVRNSLHLQCILSIANYCEYCIIINSFFLFQCIVGIIFSTRKTESSR